MNKIEACYVNNKYSSDFLAIFIDEKPLDILLFELNHREDYHGLMPAWLTLDNTSEQEYIWEILSQVDIKGLSVPILLCPDDMDLSCTIIVAKVFYTHNEVIWDKIGIVNKENWSITDWRKSGIRNTNNWLDDDWGRYCKLVDISDIWDKSWEIWISNNWAYEESMRVKYYTHSYLNNDNNVEWFSDIPKFSFNKIEYLECIERFRIELLNNA